MKLFRRLAFAFLGLFASGLLAAADLRTIYSTRFNDTPLGRTPAGWRDLVNYRPARNWAVDGNGVLRVMLKEYVGDATSGDRKIRRDYLATFGLRYTHGVLVYYGLLADRSSASELEDVSISATVRKTPDDDVTAGLLLRVKDRDNYYAALLRGDNRLEIVRMTDGKPEILADFVTRHRITDAAKWTMTFQASGDLLTALLHNEAGELEARVDAKDAAFARGTVGATLTTFAGLDDFAVAVPGARQVVHSQAQIDAANLEAAAWRQEPDYPVVAAAANPSALNTPFDQIAERYDVVVAGAGTGGFGAALQAARMGAKVLLLEETDHIGGQMANAAVTSMDEGGFWGKNTVRERGLFREFHESAVLHYYTRLKDPFTAYHFNRQSEAGFEPRVARAILYGMIEETRGRTVDGRKVVLDLAVRTQVATVRKEGDTVVGAMLREWTEQGPREKFVACHVLVDATEYGDVIPLTGARYRMGIATTDQPNPAARLQDHTWVGVIREYPDGVPAHLQFKEPPPGAEHIRKRFRNYALHGTPQWGGEHRRTAGSSERKPPRAWWGYVAWRGMPDSLSPATGEPTEQRHTRCGLNGGNDYPVSAATLEDAAQRRRDELAGINLTLSIVWWFQNVLGLPWSVVDDEGYATPLQLQRMRERGVREDLLTIAAHLPQWPYVRESRRIFGVETVRCEDIYKRTRGDEVGKHWASAIAINDYSIDLHGTESEIETDLDEANYVNATGPFQVPLGAFVPETIDGFLPAEKNFSQSRLVNGATRLQPSTMLNGQAVGALAALAARHGVQPRRVNIIEVQSALLSAGSTLLPRWYSDVSWGTPLWQATQLLALYGLMDRPGLLVKDGLLGESQAWGAGDPVAAKELRATLEQLRKVIGASKALAMTTPPATRGELALLVADYLRERGKHFVGDAAPYSPPYDLSDVRKRANQRKVKSEKSKAPARK